MRYLTASLLSVMALALAGCSTIDHLKDATFSKDPEITNIVGEVWKVETSRPIDVRPEAITDHLMDRARAQCENRKLVMLPIRGNVTNDGRHGWMEFRCQAPLNYQPEYQGLRGFFSLGDDDDKKVDPDARKK